MNGLLPSDGNFWRRWDDHYRRLGIDAQYCRDGVGDVEAYRAASRKVLFVLKEPNKWGDRADMRSQLRNGPEYLIWHNVARWAAGMLAGFPPYDEIADPEIKKQAFRSIAAINLKKASGGASSQFEDVNLHAFRDRHLLREQISSINPDIILACGQEVFGPLMWLLNLCVDDEAPFDEPAFDQSRDITVLRWRHPAAREEKVDLYNRLAERALRAGIGAGG